MRVHVCYSVDVDNEVRRSINEWYGRPGLADRAEIRRWYMANGDSMDADLREMAARRDESESA